MDSNLFVVHPKVAILFSSIEYLFVLNTLVGNKDKRGKIQELYLKIASDKDLYKIFKDIIVANDILSACQKIMDFKTTNGRGLPWSIKKEISILYNSVCENYVFPMPSDHRELI